MTDLTSEEYRHLVEDYVKQLNRLVTERNELAWMLDCFHACSLSSGRSVTIEAQEPFRISSFTADSHGGLNGKLFEAFNLALADANLRIATLARRLPETKE